MKFLRNNSNQPPEGHVSEERKRAGWRLIGWVIFVPLAFVVIFVCWQVWLFQGGIFKTSRFHSSEWKSLGKHSDDFDCYRGGMVQDIQERVILAGMSRQEVESLLGQPEIRTAFDKNVAEYSLGACSGFGFDLDTLDVLYDSDERVVRVYSVQH